MNYPRILTIQDISCLGQCSATVALPILSACGCETCLLPTMLLSTHTGGLGIPTRQDLTVGMEGIIRHWKSQDITFDAIYVGYLGRIAQIRQVQLALDTMLAPEGRIIVDPAMADHGRLYSGLEAGYAEAMQALCSRADLLIPNETEAVMLTGFCWLPAALQALGKDKAVVLTGVTDRADATGCTIRMADGRVEYVTRRKLPGSYHGTGDMFASVLVGKWMTGHSLRESAEIAADFVSMAIQNTIEDPAHSYGVKFETALPMLWEG